MRKIMMGSILTLLGLSGCNLPGGIGLVPNPTRLPTVIASSVPTEAPTDTATSEPTLAPTETETSPPTETPLPSDTPTQTLTPTPESLTGTGTKQAFCRWGPGSDYIEAGVYLYPDDVVLVHGQTLTLEGVWYWVQLPDIDYNCWVYNNTLAINGDPKDAKFVTTFVPVNDSVGSTGGITTARNGNKVSITWNAAPASVGLGYLVEGFICQNGLNWLAAFSTQATTITITDDQGCATKSSGTLRVFNKLGYSTAVNIPWP